MPVFGKSSSEILVLIAKLELDAKKAIQDLNLVDKGGKAATAALTALDNASQKAQQSQSTLGAKAAGVYKQLTQGAQQHTQVIQHNTKATEQNTQAQKKSSDQLNETSAAYRKGTAAVTPFGIAVRGAKNAIDGFALSGPVAVAAGFAIYEIFKKVLEGVMAAVGAFGQMGNLFQVWEAQLGVLLGGAQQAADAILFVRKAAIETPFDLPGLMDAVRLLTAFGLDYQFWFTRVADVAALTGKSVDQVTRAIGLLASGATGRGLYYLRLLGISTEDLGVQMDKSGQAITDTQTIMANLVRLIDTKFAGGAKAMSKTWGSVMQNMVDTFLQFAGYVGKPVLDTLAIAFDNLVQMASQNLPEIERVGTAIGTALANAISFIGPLISALITLAQVASAVATSIANAFAQVAAFITGVMNQLLPGVMGILGQVGAAVGGMLGKIFPGAKKLAIPLPKKAIVPGTEELAAEQGAGAGGGGGERISPAEKAAKAELAGLEDELGNMRREHEAQRDALRAEIEAAQEIRQQEIDIQEDLLTALEDSLEDEKEILEDIKKTREEEVKLRQAQLGLDEDQLEIAELAAKENTARAKLVLDRVGRTTRKWGNNILSFAEMNANAQAALAEEQQTRVELQQSMAERVRKSTEAQYADDIEFQEERIELIEDQAREQRRVLDRMKEIDSRLKRAEEARLREFDMLARAQERALEARIDAMRRLVQGMENVPAAGAGVGGISLDALNDYLKKLFGGISEGITASIQTLPDTLEGQQARLEESSMAARLQEKWQEVLDWFNTTFVPGIQVGFDQLGQIQLGDETLLEKFNRLKATIQDMADKVMPPLIQNFADFVRNLGPARDALEGMIGPLANIAGKLWYILTDFIIPFLSAGVLIVIREIAGALPGIGIAISGVAKLVEWFLVTLSNWIDILVIVLEILIGKKSLREGLDEIALKFENLGKAFELFYEAVTTISIGLVEIIAGMIKGIVDQIDIFNGKVSSVQTSVEAAKENLAKAVEDTFFKPFETVAIKLVGEDGKSGLIGGITTAVQNFISLFKKSEDAAEPTTKGIEKSWKETHNLLIGGSIIPEIEDGITTSFSNMERTVPSIVQRTTNAILQAWRDLRTALLDPKKGVITKMVADIKIALDLADWAYAAGQDLLYNWIEGLKSNWYYFTSAVKAIIAELDKIPRVITTVIRVIEGSGGISDVLGTGGSSYTAGELPVSGIKGSAQHGRYIPETGIYRLHPGEIVVPAQTVGALADFLSSGWPDVMRGLAIASQQLGEVAYMMTRQQVPAYASQKAMANLNVNVTVHGVTQPQAVADNITTAIDDWWWQQVKR